MVYGIYPKIVIVMIEQDCHPRQKAKIASGQENHWLIENLVFKHVDTASIYTICSFTV